MRRATTLYIVTLLGLVVGLWAIVWVGDTLHAPRDFSGVWQIEPKGSPSPFGLNVHVQQSGNYWHVVFDNGPTLDLVSTTPTRPQPAERVVAADNHYQLTFDLTPGQEATATLTGDTTQTFAAKWIGPENGSRPPVDPALPSRHLLLHQIFHSHIALLIAQVFIVLALSRLMGVLFARLHQPQVVGEMLAGIMLGPSLFGLLFPAASATLFPQAGLANLDTLSQVGVIFFLFLIGLELDPKLIRNRGHAALVISHVSIVAPFILGAALTLVLYRTVFNQEMRFLSVALFMGASMSITAFPVLARILTERNLHKTPVGAVAITCAAVDDVTAWCMLAFVVAIARANGVRPALLTAAGAIIYVLVMFFLIRPFLRRLQAVHERQGLSQNVVAIIFLLTLASAYTTEAIGIHALFGAFLMGTIMPKGTQFVRTLTEKLEDFTVVFLLPLFFAYTGLKTQIGLLNHASLWFDTGLIVLVACLGKFGGSAAASLACGMGRRESSIIGILMNTRGLMELVILNIGRDLGVITPAVFAMMVIMALVTTGITTPVLQLLGSKRLFGQALSPGASVARRPGVFSVLIPVADPRSAAPLFRMAEGIAGNTESGGRVVALHLAPPIDRDAYRSGLRQAELETPPDPLRPIIDLAATSHVSVKPMSFVSRDVAADIAKVCRDEDADLVLMGFHKSVVGRAILGGTVHRVLTHAKSDVGVFVDRGFSRPEKVLIPYLGGRHDRLALELAARLGRNVNASITVLHVVDPDRADRREHTAAQAVDRVYKDPAHPTPVTVRVVEDISPVDAVLRTAAEFDLVVIGVSEKWGLSSHLFGWRPERIAARCPVSLLIVRQLDNTTEDSTDAAAPPAHSAAPVPPPATADLRP